MIYLLILPLIIKLFYHELNYAHAQMFAIIIFINHLIFHDIPFRIKLVIPRIFITSLI